MKCSTDLIQAAVNDRLEEQPLQDLQFHLTNCESCREMLDQATAGTQWWQDATRFLDASVLSDPDADSADSSTGDARLFEEDDPVGELRAIGAIDPSTHPEMLGMLGRYTIEREIGSGGMGVVLKAHDAELSRTVAIKVLAPHLARSGAAKQRFVREGRAAAAVVHENVVAIHEVDSSGKLPSLVMRYVDGISLQRHVDLYGPLSVHDALRIGSQTAAGLAAAHRQGIIHRDVKPANILINHSCNRAWISDFGLARAVDDASLTRTGFIAGTPHYMSPEQARGSDVGPTSDLFSLGAVLYFMFAARPPWRAERSLAVLHRIVQHDHRPLSQINSDVPVQVSDLVDRLLRKRVSDRPDSASEVQQELEQSLSLLQHPVSQRTPLEITESLRPNWWTRPWFVAPTSAAITCLALLLASSFNPASDPTPPTHVMEMSDSRSAEAFASPVEERGWRVAKSDLFASNTPSAFADEPFATQPPLQTSAPATSPGELPEFQTPAQNPSRISNAPGGFVLPTRVHDSTPNEGTRAKIGTTSNPRVANAARLSDSPPFSDSAPPSSPANPPGFAIPSTRGAVNATRTATIPPSTWAELHELEQLLEQTERRFQRQSGPLGSTEINRPVTAY